MFDIHLSFRCTLFSKETRISDRLRQKGKIFKVRLDWLKLEPDVSVQNGNLYPFWVWDHDHRCQFGWIK